MFFYWFHPKRKYCCQGEYEYDKNGKRWFCLNPIDSKAKVIKFPSHEAAKAAGWYKELQ